MSKSILRSIKPYWLYLVLIGKKKLEVGKSRPQADDWDKKVYLYCSKDMQSFNRIPESDRTWMQKYLSKIACEFICNEIGEYGKDKANLNALSLFSCVPLDELEMYASHKTRLYGWKISNLVIYDKPKELSEFSSGSSRLEFSNTEDGFPLKWSGMKRPPQSWCYAESEVKGK